MADRRAVNKYYPPEWDPSQGSINKHNKSHPLRARARKLDQGILVIRFEMPFNIWCLNCNNHIGMGVRYNAEKTKVASYYSTPIYEFKMKCHLCDNYFIIRTDPSKFDYAIESGARRQVIKGLDERQDERDIDKQASISQLEALQRAEEAKHRLTDSMSKLERKLEDKMKAQANQPTLRDLKKWRSRWEDDFSMNQLVRSHYRKHRKQIERARDRDRKLLKKTSLKILLEEPSSSDAAQARRIMSQVKVERAKNQELTRKLDILNASQFIPKSSSSKVDKTKDRRSEEGAHRTRSTTSLRIKKETS